jgi:hypothetical protein
MELVLSTLTFLGLSRPWLQALCGVLYEDEQNIIKEFEDDCSSQLRKVCFVNCA